MEVNNKMYYVHQDDPNELVEYRRLLIASVLADRTNPIKEKKNNH